MSSPHFINSNIHFFSSHFNIYRIEMYLLLSMSSNHQWPRSSWNVAVIATFHHMCSYFTTSLRCEYRWWLPCEMSPKISPIIWQWNKVLVDTEIHGNISTGHTCVLVTYILILNKKLQLHISLQSSYLVLYWI